MRTLKKTLCLVLVLAMMVGLCAMGASAITFDDYPDKDSIKHPLAVTVMTSIGVLQGDDRGFRGQDNLNRAEGATFYTKLCATVGGGVPTFTDMAGYEWANGAVNWCEQNNIIAGYGDGTFHPGDPISYVQWCKMGLVAIGYDPVYEGLVGDQWEINTIKLVNKLNLAKDVTNISDWSAPISRDDAAQIGFNVLQATMVEYKGNWTVTTSDGTKVEALGDGAQYIQNNAYSYSYWLSTEVDPGYEDTLEFVENYFPTLKRASGYDDYGYPVWRWYIGKNRNDNVWTEEKQIAVELKGGVMAEYTTPATVTAATIYADAGVNTDTTLRIFENGVYVTGKDATVIELTKNGTGRLGYGGATATLIDSDQNGVANYLAVKYAYPAMVTGEIAAAKNNGVRAVKLAVYNGGDKPLTATFETDDFNLFDVVMVYPKGAIASTYKASELNIIEVTLADSTKGTLTKAGQVAGLGVTTLTVDGVLYPVGAAKLANMGLEGATVAFSAYTMPTTYTLYMNNGAVLGVAGEAASYSDFVFAVNSVVDTSESATLPHEIAESSIYNTGAVKQDATTEALVTVGAVAKGWYTTRTASGVTTFTEPAATLAKNVKVELKAGDTQIKKDNATLKDDTYKLVSDAKTVFVFLEKAGTKNAYHTYTGIANIPTYTLTKATTAYGLVGAIDGIAKAVFIDLTGSTAESTTTETVFILNSAWTTKEYDSDNKVTVYNYPAVVDGAFGTIQSTKSGETGSTLTVASGLVVPARNAFGYVTDTARPTAGTYCTYSVSGDTALNVSNGTLIIGGVELVTSSNVQVFYYENAISANNIEAGALTDLIGLKDVTVTSVFTSAKNHTVTAVYVVPTPKLT